MERVINGIIQLTRDIAVESIRLCNWLEKKCWRNKEIMKLVKELRKTAIDSYRYEMAYYSPDKSGQKILWKELRPTNEKEHRDTTPIGHLRWREKGFRKQNI